MKTDVLGVKITSEKKDQILGSIQGLLAADKKIFIVTPYSEFIVAAQTDKRFQEILNAADFALPDGIGILWAAHYLKSKIKNQKSKIWLLLRSLLQIIFHPSLIQDPIPEKISGAEFIWDLAALAAKNDYSIFLLGGYGDTPKKSGESLRAKFPNLKIAGSLMPSSPDEGKGEVNILDSINKSNADFLFVALGPIRQENWIYENLPKLRIKLAIGLGGTFDYLANKRPFRPKIWARMGLEWLWRLLTQPWRIIRIFRGVFGLVYYCLKK